MTALLSILLFIGIITLSDYIVKVPFLPIVSISASGIWMVWEVQKFITGQ